MTSEFQIARAARTVLSGGVIAYPTEGVYGLGSLPDDADAVARILAIKKRDWRKGLLLIAANLAQVEAHAVLPTGEMGRRVLASWPGPVTWLLEARSGVPEWITGGRATIGIRVTDHPIARRLCERTGRALVSTSANLSGRPPLTNLISLRHELGSAVDYVLPGQLGSSSAPTKIIDAASGAVIRPG